MVNITTYHPSGRPPSLSFSQVTPQGSLILCLGTTSIESKDKQWWIFLRAQTPMISPSLFTFFFFECIPNLFPLGWCHPSYLTMNPMNRDIALFYAMPWHRIDSLFSTLTVKFAALCDVGKQKLLAHIFESHCSLINIAPCCRR